MERKDHSHDEEDLNAKSDPRGFQEGFLEECKAALDAGFEPDDKDPVVMELGVNATDEDFDAMWAEAGQ